MKQILLIILSSSLLYLLTGCATRPYVAIQNKSGNDLKLELVLDTENLGLVDLVAQYIYDRKQPISSYCRGYSECDSIHNVLLLGENKHLIYQYVYDSLPIRYFFITNNPYPSHYLEEYQVHPLDISGKDFKKGEFNVNFNQTIRDYYHDDSLLVNKIINENTVTLFLPAHNMFAKQCHATGDASCDVEDAFPNVKELRIIISKDNVITVTKQNLKRVMKNKSIHQQSDSYAFVIE